MTEERPRVAGMIHTKQTKPKRRNPNRVLSKPVLHPGQTSPPADANVNFLASTVISAVLRVMLGCGLVLPQAHDTSMIDKTRTSGEDEIIFWTKPGGLFGAIDLHRWHR